MTCKRKINCTILILFILLVYSQGFAQWSQITSPVGGEFTSIAYDGSRLYCGTYGGGIYSSDDLGINWTTRGLDDPYNPIKCILTEGELLFASLESEGVFFSSDHGENWTSSNNGLPQGNVVFHLAALDSFIFAETFDEIYASTNNGDTWFLQNDGIQGKNLECLITKDSLLFQGTDDGVYYSTNHGEEWIERSNGLPGGYVFNFAIIGDTLIAHTNNGIFISQDEGLNWTITAGNGYPGSGWSLVSLGSNIFISTGHGIYKSSDIGYSWSKISNGYPDLESTFSLGTADNLLFAGSTSDIYGWNDGDSAWTKRDDGILAYNINSMGASENKLYFSTEGGKLYNTSDGGFTWNFIRTPSNDSFFSLLINGDTIYAASYQSFYYSSDSGAHWSQSYIQDYVVTSLAVDEGAIYLGTVFSGGVLKSTDDGYSWEQVNNGLGNLEVTQVASDGMNIFAGTQGGLYISPDWGENWNPAGGIPSNSMISKIKAIDNNIYAGSSYGIYLTTNHGSSWQNKGMGSGDYDDITGYNNVVFVGIWYGVYASTNRGDTWQAINDGLPHTSITNFALIDTTLYAGVPGHGLWKRSANITLVNSEEENHLHRFNLFQNYPNPFNPVTTIRYELLEAGSVQIKVYNILGKEIETLINEYQSAGSYSVQFNGTGLASGIYIYRLKSGNYTAAKKLILLK